MANEISENFDNGIDIGIEGLEKDLPEEDDLTTPTDRIKSLDALTKETKKDDEPVLHPNGKDKLDLKTKIKESKNIKFLLIVLSVLIATIVAFIYLSGSEEIKTPTSPIVKANELPPIETYKFKLDHINVSRLNKKLTYLTKYELLGITEEEYLKKEKLKEEQLKAQLEQEAIKKAALKKAQEEELAKQKKIQDEQEKILVLLEAKKEQIKEDPPKVTKISQEKNVQKNVQKNKNIFLKFIQINTNKKLIYKSYLKKLKEVDSRINACRNINNYIEVFVGPLKDDETTMLLEAIKKTKQYNDVISIELTKQEFASRCMVFEN